MSLKYIHQIWIGPAPISVRHRAWMTAVEAMHPGWDYKLWKDEEANVRFPEFARRRNDFKEHPILAADLLRYHIMNEIGGLYLDADTVPIKPFDELVENHRAFVGLERESTCANGTIYCGAPRMEWIDEILNSIPEGELTFENSGIKLFSRVASRYPEVHKFPREYFYPMSWNGRLPTTITGNTHAIQLYTALWKK